MGRSASHAYASVNAVAQRRCRLKGWKTSGAAFWSRCSSAAAVTRTLQGKGAASSRSRVMSCRYRCCRYSFSVMRGMLADMRPVRCCWRRLAAAKLVSSCHESVAARFSKSSVIAAQPAKSTFGCSMLGRGSGGDAWGRSFLVPAMDRLLRLRLEIVAPGDGVVCCRPRIHVTV